jgi:protease-4
MKINPLVQELSRGLWAMSFEGLNFWGPIAHKILTRETIDNKIKPNAILSVFDSRGQMVARDQDGGINAPKGSVAVIDIKGALLKEGDWCSYGAVEIVNALKAADDNPNIVGSVAYFDGPGGSVSAIAPFVAFGKTKKKPIVGLYDQCCSAHLYAMYSMCDYVIAENDISAVIGSCGIVLSFADNREYLEKLGYKFHEVYPEESKDKNQAFALALEGKYDMIKKEMLSPLAIKFQDAVKAARPNLKLDEPGIITGKTFFTDHAIDIGLTDSKGTLNDAIERVKILSEMNSLYK